MPEHAERGMSAPPEVVFNTATDPARAAWLPDPLRGDGRPTAATGDGLCARWDGGTGSGWSAQLRVEPVDAGGARVRLELEVGADPVGDLEDGPDRRQLAALADEALACLAREVADNLTAG